MRVSRVWMPGGDFGTYFTLAAMQRLVRDDAPDPTVRRIAIDAIDGTGINDAIGHIVAIRDYLSRHVIFLRDPFGSELLHGPKLLAAKILTEGVVHVDCDDVAMLSAAMGKAIGLRTRFVVVGFRSQNSPYRHVWTEISPGSGNPSWFEMDITRPAQGIAASSISRRFVREV